MVEETNNNPTNNEFLKDFNTDDSFNPYSTSTHEGEDFTVFPPSNHENLVPTQFDPDPVDPPSSSPPPYPVVPRWWIVSVEILRSRIGKIWSCFGCGGGGGRAIGKFGNVSFVAVAAVVGWWLWVGVRRWTRRRRRRENVGHLLRIIREKDERILQLLNQIAQMNEVLLARNKTLASGN